MAVAVVEAYGETLVEKRTCPYQTYGSVAVLLARHQGSMAWDRTISPHGAWKLTCFDKTKVIKATGRKSFPELDQLYVPKVVNPRTWEDRHSALLLDDAEEKLLALFGKRLVNGQAVDIDLESVRTGTTQRPGKKSLFRGKDRAPVSITLTPDHHKKINSALKRLGMSRSDAIGLLIDTYADNVAVWKP